MKKICLLVAAAALCACGGHHHPEALVSDTPLPPAPGPTVAEPPPKPAEPVRTVAAERPAPAVDEPPRIPPPSLVAVIAQTNARLEDAFFPYDRSDADPKALDALRRDAAILVPVLADFPQILITVEGHCDERGSAEYNLALGDRRAAQAVAVLEQFHVPAAALTPVSFGKERPQCTEANEPCWSRNRRAHLVLRAP